MQLNQLQQVAADHIDAMLARMDVAEAFLLLGYAGTGKSATLAHVLGPRRDVLFVTPSHKAKNVLLEAMPYADVQTLHRALGYKPAFAGRARYFAPERERSGAYKASALAQQIGKGKRIIVLDECSMIGGGIFELLLEQLGMVDGAPRGARSVLERQIDAKTLDDLAERERVMSLVFGPLRRCAIDQVSKVIGRPTWTGKGDLVYRVEGPRVPVKLIVMGDPGQLAPVVSAVPAGSPLLALDPELAWCQRAGLLEERDGKMEPRLDCSPTLTAPIYGARVQLVELMRADRPDLKEHNLKARIGAETGKIHLVTSRSASVQIVAPEALIERAVEAYRAQEDCVALAYRNATCAQLNDAIRQRLLGPNARRDVLHAGEPCDLHTPIRLETGDALDNGDLVYLKSVRPATWREVHPYAMGAAIPCYEVAVERARDGLKAVTLWLARDQQPARDELLARLTSTVEGLDYQIEQGQLALTLLGAEDQRLTKAHLEELAGQRDLAMDLCRRLEHDIFADLRPAYAKTVHKAQGGGWDKVLYVQGDVRTGRASDRAKLAYVAISRAKQQLIVSV